MSHTITADSGQEAAIIEINPLAKVTTVFRICVDSVADPYHFIRIQDVEKFINGSRSRANFKLFSVFNGSIWIRIRIPDPAICYTDPEPGK